METKLCTIIDIDYSHGVIYAVDSATGNEINLTWSGVFKPALDDMGSKVYNYIVDNTLGDDLDGRLLVHSINEVINELKRVILDHNEHTEDYTEWMSEYLYDYEYNGGVDGIISNAIENHRSNNSCWVPVDDISALNAVGELLNTYNTEFTKQKLADIILESSVPNYIADIYTQWSEVARIPIGEQEIDLLDCLMEYNLDEEQTKEVLSRLADDRDICVVGKYAIYGGDMEYWILKLDDELFIQNIRKHFNK